MNTEKMREAIIDLLASTRTHSEGVTADLIIALFDSAGGDGEAVATDDESPARKAGELGNMIHNLGCENQNNEDLSDRLAELAHQAWMLQREITNLSPAPAAKPMSDDIEQSFQAWVRRNCPPGNHMNLFRGAHSAGYWDGQESVAPDYEQAPAAKVPKLTDAEINQITLDTLRSWPSFDAQVWACHVVKAVIFHLNKSTQPPELAVPEITKEELQILIDHHNYQQDCADSMDAGTSCDRNRAEELTALLSAAPTPEQEQ